MTALFISKNDAKVMSVALDQMPEIFTGNEFSAVCEKEGLSRVIGNCYKRTQFLEINCTKLGRRRWEKKPIDVPVGQQAEIQFDEAEFQRACDLIKSRGGKILMPVTEFKEL